MAIVKPFRALRYNTRDPLSVALVTAPPYDCITPTQQDELYRTHPHNIVRLILGREEPGDGEGRNKYARAADLLAKWTGGGILARDAEPGLYFYQQEFEVEGESYRREGFFARVRLEEFGSGRIFPHEETMSAPKEDRLRLLRAARANLSAVFSLYPDEENSVTALFHANGLGDPVVQTVDGDGVVHRLFECTDPKTIRQVTRAMADRPLFIADGHHRYETALAYRREHEAQGETVDAGHPAGCVLMMCVSMHHPGLVILPVHRVLQGLEGLEGLETDRLRKATAGHFEWTEFAGAEATSPRLTEHLREKRCHAFGLWTRDTSRAFLLSLKNTRVMDRLAKDHSKAWRQLDVAILQRVLLEHDLPRAVEGMENLTLSYVHLAQKAFDAVHEDGADAAFLLRPLPVADLQAVAKEGERMPPKSTYFYPKVLSGLVINPHDPPE
ncbi:MAG: DUF1015 domain-containing protein [Phycisphaerae bacterium]